MHLARIKRNGNTGLKTGSHGLEKLPHKIVDNYIKRNCKNMLDEEMSNHLKKLGYDNATIWTVKYRRRKLGFKKYLYGEVKKHKAWIRSQAIKKYGQKCEFCDYDLTIDIHHIKPKHKGGLNEIDNLMILCPNCHAIITRKIFILDDRKDILKIKNKIKELLKN